jgi:hypothetical protein
MELKKCFKSFLMAKKLIDSDKDKSFEYFKQSLKYINLAKKKNNNKEIIELLDKVKLKQITLDEEIFRFYMNLSKS